MRIKGSDIIVSFTPEEIKILERNPFYIKYSNSDFTSLTPVIVKADLDLIQRLDIINMPILKYLQWLYDLVAWAHYYGDAVQTAQDVYSMLADTQRSMYLEAPLSTSQVHDSAYLMEEYTATLSSGALANAVFRAAHGTKKYSVAWIVLNWDVAPATAYTLDFHEASGATNRLISYLPADNGTKKYLYWDQPTAATDLQCSFAGGAGAEILELDFVRCTI